VPHPGGEDAALGATGKANTPSETWLDLEKLSAVIFAELEPESVVTHDARLQGNLSQAERQIDVLIENPSTHARVIVDCKDWRRRVNVNDVGAFASLVEDVEGTGGVMVCNRGFSKAAHSFARVKGVTLCGVHDVESRRWQLDVLIPVVWTQIEVTDLQPSLRCRLAAGDSLPTTGSPELRSSGRPFDPLQSFVEIWNRGELGVRPGDRTGRWRGETPVEVVTVEGAVRYGLFGIEVAVAERSRLGYLSPKQSRGIVDFETGAYQTVRLNAATTLLQQPEGGWLEIGRPDELAIAPRATVLTLSEVSGIQARWTGIKSITRVGD
jgi:hypothetical protein